MREFDDWLTIRSLPLARARDHLRDIGKLGVPIDDVAIFQTSGTSGEPAVVVLPSSFVEYSFGISMARFDRHHWKLVRDIRKLGVRVTITGGNGPFAGVGFNKLVRNLQPRLAKVLTFIEAEQPIDRLVEQLNAIPKVSSISTYPSMLIILAKEKEAGRLQIDPVVISTGGETLTDDLRARVRRAFPSLKYGILDTYGCTECLALSFECSCRRKARVNPVEASRRAIGQRSATGVDAVSGRDHARHLLVYNEGLQLIDRAFSLERIRQTGRDIRSVSGLRGEPADRGVEGGTRMRPPSRSDSAYCASAIS
jgi:phenylacetate-coenzyme A ligase PaaK-like adenylate-forming protein